MTEAPTLEAPSMEGYDPKAAQNIFNPGSDQTPPPTETKTVESTPELADESPKPEIAEKKSTLDKIGSLKEPEKKKEEAPKVEGQPEPAKKSNAENLRVLREAKTELESIKPEYEKIKGEYESLKDELTKLKATNLNDDERKEYDNYKNLYAVESVQNSKEYKHEILAPIQQRLGKLQMVAEKANLSPELQNSLYDAVDQPDEWERNKAIRGVLQQAELESEEYQEAVRIATSIASDLNENWYPKQDAKLAQAHQIQLAARQKQQEELGQMTQARQQEMQKHMQEVQTALTKQVLKPLMDDTNLSVDGTTLADALKGAKVPDNPQDMALAVQLFQAAPFMIQKLNSLLQEVSDLKEANRLRDGVAPSRSDGLPKTVEPGGSQLTAEDVFGRRR